jgi:transcription antitermination factor NusG
MTNPPKTLPKPSHEASQGGDWYAVATFSQAEWEAYCSAGRMGFTQRWYPTWRDSVRKSRWHEPRLKPHLPGYIFVHAPSWQSPALLNGQPGVHQVVSWSGRPEPVPARVMAALHRRFDDVLDHPLNGSFCPVLSPGRKHKISDGPFKSFVAVIEALVNADEIDVDIDIFGRPCRTRLPVSALGEAI